MDVATNLAIRELLSRAAYALDVRDMEMLEACFSPDAVMELQITGMADEMLFEGRDNIMGLMRQSAEEQTDQRRHITTNVFFESDSQVVSNLTLTAVENGQIRLVTSGYYKDTVKQEATNWVIAKRRIELDMPY